MIEVWIEQAWPWWFGVAVHGKRLVATTIGHDREKALRSVLHCLPHGSRHRLAEDRPGKDRDADYPRSIVAMLARLEGGSDERPKFELCPDCVPEPLASVLCAASRIPRGYVTTYGRIAAEAHTEARVVGQFMSTNPLYPIVPCHRVVGADMALVGYSGRQDEPALRSKLDRLRAEVRGFTEEKTLDDPPGLVVTPAEWVLYKAARDGIGSGVQLSLW